MKHALLYIMILLIVFVSCSKTEIRKEYYENGILKSKNSFKDNELHGQAKTYYENGELKSILNYKDGKLEGEVKFYYNNGNLQSVVKYNNGILNGEVLNYYDNGNLKSKGFQKEGEVHGYTWIYFENGKLEQKLKYNLGKRIDTTFFYYENGNLKSLQVYDEFGSGIYLKTFDINGEIEFDSILPKVSLNTDSIEFGEFLNIQIDLIKEYEESIRIDLGVFSKSQEVFNADTSIVFNGAIRNANIQFKPKTKGQQSIEIQFNYDSSTEEPSPDGVIVKKHFIVY